MTESIMSEMRKLRIFEGKSLSGLARELGMSVPTLRRLERGEPLQVSSITAWADHFEVTVEDAMELGVNLSKRHG